MNDYDAWAEEPYDPEQSDALIASFGEPEPPEYLRGSFTGDWLDAQEFPPLQWSVPNLIPEGYGVLVGAPKIGKSWLVLSILLEVACGGLVLSAISVAQRPVFYLAFEDGKRRLQSRARKLLGSATKIPANFRAQVEPTERVIQIMDSWLADNPNGIVAVDTLGKIESLAFPPMPGGESAYARDYRIGSTLKNLADRHPGASVIVVHHVNKGASSDWMNSTSGTNGINGAADWTINLSRPRNSDTGLIRVTGRDVTEGEYAATMDDGAWRLVGGSLEAAASAAREAVQAENLGDTSAQILAYVNNHPDGVTAKQVEDALGIDRAGMTLRRLDDSGRITKLERGKFGPA